MRRSGNSDLQDDPTGLRNAGIRRNDQRKKNGYVWIRKAMTPIWWAMAFLYPKKLNSENFWLLNFILQPLQK